MEIFFESSEVVKALVSHALSVLVKDENQDTECQSRDHSHEVRPHINSLVVAVAQTRRDFTNSIIACPVAREQKLIVTLPLRYFIDPCVTPRSPCLLYVLVGRVLLRTVIFVGACRLEKVRRLPAVFFDLLVWQLDVGVLSRDFGIAFLIGAH